MRIAVGCDHRGLEAKQVVIKLLTEAGHSYNDFGTYTKEPVDYPDIAKAVGEAVAKGDFNFGILICGTGIGMCIAANKVKAIRAAQCYDTFCAQRARQHNDANVLCLKGEMAEGAIREIVYTFLNSKFEGGRHLRRVEKIRKMES